LAKPFVVKDCALITLVVDVPPVFDLRDLRERLKICPEESLYHHFCQTLLRPTFDDPEFHNDLAFWARHNLHDKTLAERLAILNPYDFPGMEELRFTLLDIVEDRIGELPHISNVQTGDEFRFLRAMTVTFEAGYTLKDPRELFEAFGRMTPSSIWYHFIEARRRNPDRLDDFTCWLRREYKQDRARIPDFSGIDFYFLSLPEIRREIVSIANTLPPWREGP
jgi:hypothetical protein